MAHTTRSATIQVRVVPIVKRASHDVLSRIGLTMSEAVELFLRRVIVDERIPFEVIALDESQIVMEPSSTLRGEKERAAIGAKGALGSRSSRGKSRKNNSKTF